VTREVDSTVDVYTKWTAWILGELDGLVDGLGKGKTADRSEAKDKASEARTEIAHG